MVKGEKRWVKEGRASEKENDSIMLKGTIFGDRDQISILDLPFIDCDLEQSRNYF